MSYFYEYKLLTTIVIIFLSYPVKLYVSRWLKHRAKRKQTDYRYLFNSTKNIINLLMLIIIFLLWANELQRFALSIAAFVVAIVLATREYIQCFIGFLYVTSTRPFRVGDWVQTGAFCGEVTATDWAKLTMLEIDQSNYSYTGKTLFIPNNQLITQPIKNLNFMKRYISHSFSITMNNSYDAYKSKDRLLAKVEEYCADFYNIAERYNSIIERSLDVQLPGPEPKISIATTDLGRIKTTFTIFCPTELAGDLTDKITADFFMFYAEQKQSAKETSSEEPE